MSHKTQRREVIPAEPPLRTDLSVVALPPHETSIYMCDPSKDVCVKRIIPAKPNLEEISKYNSNLVYDNFTTCNHECHQLYNILQYKQIR